MPTAIRIGTRGSALALYQANWVAARLRDYDPGRATEIVVLKTTGDLRQDIPLPEMAGKGIFVREIEAALIARTVDIAVHSAKDLQSTDPAGLTIGAFGERADARDALVSPRYGSLAELPTGAVVATGAPRRVAQLRAVRPDLRFVEIRGNVDTRLAKLDRGDADALILAVAGLARLGRESVITEKLPLSVSLPQVGQAAIAVQCRSNDGATELLLRAAIDHAATRQAVVAERAFLALVGGGCTAPIAAHATEIGGERTLSAFVASPTGDRIWRATRTISLQTGQEVARSIYNELLERGADFGTSALL
jgi:hydroxymethylbilane synthase